LDPDPLGQQRHLDRQHSRLLAVHSSSTSESLRAEIVRQRKRRVPGSFT